MHIFQHGLHAGVLLGLLACSSAFADDKGRDAEREACEAKADREKVVVVGSHIKRCQFDSIAPVVIIERDEIERSGASSVADVLRRLPYARVR